MKFTVISLVAVFFTEFISANDKPNFVWIISEDNSIHYLNHFFPDGADTPNIKKMAMHGVTFDNAFSNAPVCSVARSTLITSCYAPRIGSQYHRRSVMAPMPEGLKMFPAYLKEIGYYTTNRSKTDYNLIQGKGVWDQSSRKAHWKNRKNNQPFFHKASYAISHESSLHFKKEAIKNQPTEHDPGKVKLAPYHPDTKTFRYTQARYHDNIVKIDNVVGGIIDELKNDGLLENTFVFYFGDHGGVLPRSKGYAFETGLHVPLVVRIPKNFKHLVKYSTNYREAGFVEFIDFGPTLLNLAGIKIPDVIDGIPFMGKGSKTREFTFNYADRFDEKYDFVRWIRKGRYSYQRNFQPFNFDALQNDYRYKQLAFTEWRDLFQQGKLNDIQKQFFEARAPEALYDINKDPYETKNLAKDPELKGILGEMRKIMQSQMQQINDLSFYPEPVMVKEAMKNPSGYGIEKTHEIKEMSKIAALQLLPFSEVVEPLERALTSANPWFRYWGCIVATTHGQNSQKLTNIISKMAGSDSEPLVRARAAEYLGVNQKENPFPFIKNALKMSSSEVETNLILNTAVLLQDGGFGHSFKTFSMSDVNFGGRYIEARIAYLAKKDE
tara:strand:- start:56 stop:1882 length:1827 start_codon:yes stop_codon:yes gene_type:complete